MHPSLTTHIGIRGGRGKAREGGREGRKGRGKGEGGREKESREGEG